jgi:hypothetical protein
VFRMQIANIHLKAGQLQSRVKKTSPREEMDALRHAVTRSPQRASS